MDPFIAQIIMFAGNFAPRGWALCDGQLLSISTHSALFSILGTTYGGDGRSTFGLPDLRGRSAVHPGNGPGLPSVSLGTRSGNPTTTLSAANMPTHSHSVNNNLQVGVSTASVNSDDPDGIVLGSGPEVYTDGAADATMGAGSIAGSLTIGNAGNGTSLSNQSPFTAVNFIIALVGTYPSRN